MLFNSVLLLLLHLSYFFPLVVGNSFRIIIYNDRYYFWLFFWVWLWLWSSALMLALLWLLLFRRFFLTVTCFSCPGRVEGHPNHQAQCGHDRTGWGAFESDEIDAAFGSVPAGCRQCRNRTGSTGTALDMEQRRKLAANQSPEYSLKDWLCAHASLMYCG